MVDISVIIVNYKGWQHLEKCLEAFVSFTNDLFSFEVIIVDNCSDDGRLVEFQRRFPQYLFIENSGNSGFSNGCNLGVKKSSGEFLLFLNSDIIANEPALYSLLLSMRNDPGLFVLSCKQMNRNGKAERLDRLFPSFLTLNGLSRSVFRTIKGLETKASSDIFYPEWVSGSVILISRLNFEQIGGWNERYWLYYEDVDLCRRITDIGGRVGIYTGASVFHNHGGSTRINLMTTALTKSEVVISLHVYLSTHFSGLQAFCLHLLVMIDVLIVKLVPSLLGIPCFFIKRLALYRIIYSKMLNYYFNALINRTWMSPRSVKYK